MKNVRNQKGITLIALAITIVVLLILAGITITNLTDEDKGVANQAKSAEELACMRADEEQIEVAIANYKKEERDESLTEYLANMNWCKSATNNGDGTATIIFGKCEHEYSVDINKQMSFVEIPRVELPVSTVTLAAGSGWYKGTTAKSKITKIIFTNSYTVTGSETESWSASINGDGQETDDYKCYITGTELTIVGNNKIVANENCSNLFANFTALIEIENLGMLDTSKATTMMQMFANCYYLKSLDVSGFNTSNVTNMYYMFVYCMRLEEFIGIENFNTSNVTNMEGMFGIFGWWDATEGSSLPVLDLSSFDISNVTTLAQMFYGSTALETIYVSSDWDTTGKTTTDMFYQCGTSKVTVK